MEAFTPEALVKQAIKTTSFATLLQIELKSDIAHFTNHIQTCSQPHLLHDNFFFLGGKTLNTVFSLPGSNWLNLPLEAVLKLNSCLKKFSSCADPSRSSQEMEVNTGNKKYTQLFDFSDYCI